ncbi:MAG TPA: dodecin family protein [Trueperaceae bacterium]|nr:dodecin family protein [Trueperaceae bacterium]
MAVVKVIEVLAQSEKSFEDAIQVALREASRTIRNIKSIYVKEMQAIVDGDRIAAYRVDTKISFALEDGSGDASGQGSSLEPEG